MVNDAVIVSVCAQYCVCSLTDSVQCVCDSVMVSDMVSPCVRKRVRVRTTVCLCMKDDAGLGGNRVQKR